MACSNKAYDPVLVNRGVEPFERKYHVTKEGYGIAKRLTKTFISGYIEEGMSQDMVALLWGVANRSNEDDTIWEYTTQSGVMISTVKFNKSKEILGRKVLLVTDVLGDRYGGSLPPGQKK